MPPRVSIDALEQRDNWRTMWRLLTHDWLLAVLSVGLWLAALAYQFLPQMPFDGATDAPGFSQWQAQARALSNGAFGFLQDLGLFDIVHALWVRLLLAGLLGILVLRLLDRGLRLLQARRSQSLALFYDENRLRVTDHAPSLHVLAERLRYKHYRVALDPTSPEQPQWLNADRAPRAELISLLMHMGLLMAALGMFANTVWGWTDQYIPISTEQPVRLSNQRGDLQLITANEPPNTVLVQIGKQAPQTLVLPPVADTSTIAPPMQSAMTLQPFTLSVAEITPEFHVSATTADKTPLPLIVSSYASAQNEAVLTFRSGETERSLAIGPEPAKLSLLISPNERNVPAAGLGRVQVFALPSGRVITEANISPNMTIEGINLSFAPTYGAVLAARYQPGNPWVWLGGVIAVLAWLGCWRYPMQRIVVRLHAPDWTEFYASGRRVAQDVRDIST
ncbi:MAG: cytochrome c biogenesis protein ResB [Anaerolineae bacterium]|nr:cytochrome c biogenesis protein ResB [Anaerolineae bacterium]